MMEKGLTDVPNNEEDVFFTRDRVNAGPFGPSGLSRVYVWDLDETLIIFQTLSNGKFAEHFKGLKDSRHGIKLGRRWEKLIIQICDDYLFYEEVEDYNEPTLKAWIKYDDGRDLSNYDFKTDGLDETQSESNNRKRAYRHRKISDLYSQGLETLLREEQLHEWQELYELTDMYTDGWLTAGRIILERCLEPSKNAGDLSCGSSLSSFVNVLVTSGGLVPSLVKCLLFKLDKFIFHDNVYSSAEVGKLQCFRWIKQCFHKPGVKFCVIGDGLDECEAAQTLGWPFLKVDLNPEALHRLPSLSVQVIESYIKVIYGDDDGVC